MTPALTTEALDIWQQVMGDMPAQAPYGAVYPRVSSELQRDKYSLPSQLQALLERARDEGVYVRREHVFWEVHTGEELWERPELTRMRGMFKTAPFTTIYFYAVDRFARKAFYAELVLDEAHRAGIAADFVLQKFEDTAEGRLMRHVAEYVAEKELYSLKERTNRGKRTRLADGKPNGGGKPPYGYQWVNGPNEKRDRHSGYAVDPDTAPVVQRIFREVAQGKGMREVCRGLMRDSIRTPKGSKTWAPGTLSVILRTDYTGVAWANRWQVVKIKGKRKNILRPREEWVRLDQDVPQIVDEATFLAAQEIKTTNKALAARNNARPDDFLLRGGFVRCATCKGTMSTRRYPTFGGHTVYICHGGSLIHGKGLGQLRAKLPNANSKLLDEAVWTHVTRMLNEEGFLEDAARRMDEHDTTPSDVAAIDARLVAVAEQINNLALAIGLTKHPTAVAALAAQLDQIADQQRALQIERETVLQRGSTLAKARQHLDLLKDRFGVLSEALARLSHRGRVTTLRALGIQVVVYPRADGTRAPLPDYEIEASIPLEIDDSDNSRFTHLSQSTTGPEALTVRWRLPAQPALGRIRG